MEGVIVSERVFGSPRAAVFRAFSDPRILARWWGPAGFTNTFEEFDLRTGGTWRFVMHGPDGSEHRMVKELVEVEPSSRIVLRHIALTHGFTMTITLDADPGGTRMTWRMAFDSPAEAQRVREQVLAANEENFDRLELQLEQTR